VAWGPQKAKEHKLPAAVITAAGTEEHCRYEASGFMLILKWRKTWTIIASICATVLQDQSCMKSPEPSTSARETQERFVFVMSMYSSFPPGNKPLDRVAVVVDGVHRVSLRLSQLWRLTRLAKIIDSDMLSTLYVRRSPT